MQTVLQEKMKLPVRMSDHDFAMRSRELIKTMQALEEVQDKVLEAAERAKMVRQQQKPNIRILSDEIRDIEIDLRHNSKIAETDVLRIIDHEKGIVFYRRADNNEIIPGKFRKATDDELAQMQGLDDPSLPPAVRQTARELTLEDFKLMRVFMEKVMRGKTDERFDNEPDPRVVRLLIEEKIFSPEEEALVTKRFIEGDIVDGETDAAWPDGECADDGVDPGDAEQSTDAAGAERLFGEDGPA